MAKSLIKLAMVPVLGCAAALMLSGCGDDNIKTVRDGYFDFEAKKSIGEIFSLCSYTSEGRWYERTLQGIDVPAVLYTATIPNDKVVSWVLPNASEQKKKDVTAALDKSGFTLQTEFSFNVFKNKSFELTYAQLKFNNHIVAADKETQDLLLKNVVSNQAIDSMPVSSEASDAFRYALAKAMLQDDSLTKDRIVSLIGPESRTFGTALIFKPEQVQNAFAPLAFSEISNIESNDKDHTLSLKVRSSVFDINDMALNEYGQTLFSDNFGIIDGKMLKSATEITNLISAYDYKPLMIRDMQLKSEFAKNDTALATVPISDLELGGVVLLDTDGNQATLDLSADKVAITISPDVSGQRPLLDYLDKQQELIEYTAVAYPIVFGASFLSSLAGGQKSDANMVKNLVKLRNKLMVEAGTQAPEPLKQSGQI